MTEWLLLTATLPTSPSALCVRVWRALKATGCAPLRDGVYLLPATAPTAQALWGIEKTILDGGAEAHMLVVTAGNAGERAAGALETLRREIERHLSPGEPTPRPVPIQQQSIERFKGKTWATRKRPWVDRLATAWLVLRFIDPPARFVWIEGTGKCPKSAVGFDFDGATFTHAVDDELLKPSLPLFDALYAAARVST